MVILVVTIYHTENQYWLDLTARYSLACRAATKDRHSCLFWASLVTVPQVWFRVLSSLSTVRRQVFFGLPRFLFPSGVQCRAVRVMLSKSLRRTCPIHLHRRRMMMVSMHSCWHWASSCRLEMVSGHDIRKILRRFLVWKVDSLVISLLVIRWNIYID